VTIVGLLAGLAAILAVAGLVQTAAGYVAVRGFMARPRLVGGELPGVTVLKPLFGDEPLLEAALASFCAQDYRQKQIVFGVHAPTDPALAVVERLRARFPDVAIAMVVKSTRWGANGKVSNLINMLPEARHDVLVISDSDIHAPADYLRDIVATVTAPGVGLATALYTGLPAGPNWVARLGATAITHTFLPGALVSRGLGRQDCLGATMALRRETLARIGGLEALVAHLADDNELGRKVAGLGLEVRLASTVPATTIAETNLPALWSHELRWARTIRALLPAQFAASALQYPIFWATLAAIFAGFSWWSLLLLAACWIVRAAAARGIDRALGLASATPMVIFPLRDLLSIAVLCASFAGNWVRWRGEALRAGRPIPENGQTAGTDQREAMPTP
jgi:ceramide glucosyltransferase